MVLLRICVLLALIYWIIGAIVVDIGRHPRAGDPCGNGKVWGWQTADINGADLVCD